MRISESPLTGLLLLTDKQFMGVMNAFVAQSNPAAMEQWQQLCAMAKAGDSSAIALMTATYLGYDAMRSACDAMKTELGKKG